MITLAASMFDIAGIANGAAEIGEMLFVAVVALVGALVVYGLAKQRLF